MWLQPFRASFLILLLVTSSAFTIQTPEASTDSPGVILTVETLAPSSSKLPYPDARLARNIAIYIPQNTPPSDFTPPGPFRATFKGDLNLRLRSYLRFSAEGHGKLTLSLNGAVVLEASGDDLSKTTSNEVRAQQRQKHARGRIRKPPAGDASLRLFWSSKTFLPEPLPPNLLTTPLPIRDGQEPRSARRAISRCPTPIRQMPHCFEYGEERRDARAFDGCSVAGCHRVAFEPNWMAAWISDPHALRPTAHMPRYSETMQTTPVRKTRGLSRHIGFGPARTLPKAIPPPAGASMPTSIASSVTRRPEPPMTRPGFPTSIFPPSSNPRLSKSFCSILRPIMRGIRCPISTSPIPKPPTDNIPHSKAAKAFPSCREAIPPKANRSSPRRDVSTAT